MARNFDTQDWPIKEIFSRYLCKVPRYQRCFSWDKEQIETFWEDLMEVVSIGKKEYFFGSFIFKQKDEDDPEVEIIDGQQRIALLTILFACIRDICHDRGDTTLYGKINSFYIYRKEYEFGEGPKKPKLIMNEQDEVFFDAFIRQSTKKKEGKKIPQRGTLQSHKFIRNAYYFFQKKILEETNRYTTIDDEWKKYMKKILDTIANNFKVILTTVDSDFEASVIFETLNDRGLDLSIADLLKNYIYTNADNNDLYSIQKRWEGTIELLGERVFVIFLRHYLSSSKALVREKKLYKVFKDALKDKKEIYEFVEDIEKEAIIYNSLINPETGLWKSPDLIKDLRSLKNMGVKQIYVLLLGAYSSLGDKEFEDFVRLSLKLTVRYNIICNLNPNDLEKKYSELAILLRRNEISFKSLKIRLRELAPDDDRFVQDFGRKEIKNSKIARYLLREIANHIKQGKEEIIEYSLIEDPKKMQLEHIMPKTLSLDWKEYMKTFGLNYKIDHERLLNRLGNLALIKGAENKKISNKIFTLKIEEYYKESNIPITNQLCSYDYWNEDSIDKRQKELADIAKEIWRL